MDHEAKPEEIGKLKHHAQDCAEHFEYLLHHEETGKILITKDDVFWVSRQCAEFNLWCAKVGIHAEGQRSLDVRLKDVPEICDIFLQLLQSLQQDLYDLRHPKEFIARLAKVESHHADDLKSNASCYSFDSLSSSEVSEDARGLKEPVSPEHRRRLELQQQVIDTIHRLQGQAKRIERAGARHRRRRIEVYREKKQKLYHDFLQLGTWKAKQQFESASAVTVDRIAESFARRRIRFAYLQEHQKKRAVDASETHIHNPGPLVEENGDKAQDPSMQPKEAAKQSNFRVTEHAQDQQTLLSATVNTEFELPPEPKRTERAESVRSIALRHPGFPPPPQTKDGRFQCPYCILDFRDVEAAPDRWKQHVMQDLEPYFCTFEKCKSPFDVTNSFEGLLNHMQSHLPLRNNIDKPDGEHIELADTESETHLNSDGGVSLGTMNLMKETSRQKPAFLFDSCPFCGGYPDVVEKRFPDPDTIDAQVELRKHIKQHMQEIALFLPPYRSDIFERDDDSKQSDATHRRSSPDEIPSDDENVLVCSRKSCDCKRPSPVDSEDLQLSEPRAGAHPEEEMRWKCCLCGNNYKYLVTRPTCTYRRCNSHQPCRNCDLWYYDYSRNGDWSFWLGATSLYDRSRASDEELIADERLHSLVLHYAGLNCGTIEPQCGAQVTGLAKKPGRTAIVHDVIESYTRLHYQSPGDDSQPRLPEKDPVFRLQERLISKTTTEHESYREPDKSEVLELSFEDIKPRQGNHFPAELDTFENVHTEAMYNGVPVWVEWFTSNARPFQQIDRVLELRAIEIVSILLRHKGLEVQCRVPPCRGYLRDEEEGRYGLVFQKPTWVDPEAKTVTLRQYFTNPGFNMPSLSQRIRIIHSLHSAVEKLHLNGLMHQGMRPDGVFFFFVKDEASAPELFPYISGFGYPDLPTQDVEIFGDARKFLYRHPRHLPGAPNHRSDNQLVLDDLYSLAIVLLEIAHWKPIDDILGITGINSDYIIPVAVSAQIELLWDGNTRIWVQTRHAIGDVVTSLIRACMDRVRAEWPGTEDLETPSIHLDASNLFASPAQAIERVVRPGINSRDRSSHSSPPSDSANLNHSPVGLGPGSASRHPASLVEPQLMPPKKTSLEEHDLYIRPPGGRFHEKPKKPNSRLRTWLKDQWPRAKKSEKSSDAHIRNDAFSTRKAKATEPDDRVSLNALDQSASASVHPTLVHGVDFSFESSPTTPRDLTTTPVDGLTTPMVTSSTPAGDPHEPEVLFLAASVFEFTAPKDRKEFGIPYLSYVMGEIFEIIDIKGELWLARDEDDNTKPVGWIWEKHCARILPRDSSPEV